MIGYEYAGNADYLKAKKYAHGSWKGPGALKKPGL